MRFEGTLKRWDDTQGYGFLDPHQGGPELFVHIRDMRHLGQRPMLGERWTFEVRQSPDGKKRAVNAERWRPERPRATEFESHGQRPTRRSSPRVGTRVGVLLLALAAAALAVWVGSRQVPRIESESARLTEGRGSEEPCEQQGCGQ